MKNLFNSFLFLVLSVSHIMADGPPTHDIFDAELSKYVNDKGWVDYSNWSVNSGPLNAYLKTLGQEIPTNSWSQKEQLAYWINAYNAFTIKLIIDHYPVNSIMDIEDGKAWDKKWINLDGNTYSLNDIENEIIRPQFKEPRIHFVVNCAARSCPPLLNESYEAHKLENQLESQTRKFLTNRFFNQISKHDAKVSKIFSWYAEDFEDLSNFLSRYTKFESGVISYNEYDWSLNGE